MHTGAFLTLITATILATPIAYLYFARRISALFDHIFHARPTPHPIDPMSIAFDPNGISSHFSLGSWGWPFGWPHAPGPLDLKIILGRHNLLILRAGARSFTFGPVQKWWTGSKPQYQFTPAPGDTVSFTRRLGLPWPTPFTINFLGGSVPKAKRYAYDLLRWTKPSGAILEITWRNEYWFYRNSTRWDDTCNNRLSRIHIHPSPLETSAAAYLKSTKGWTADEYRLEPERAESEDAIVNVIYLKDESAAPHPGGGQSVILRMNKSSGKVISESGWQ